MTRDEVRAKCIEEAAKAYYETKQHINVTYPIAKWEELGPISRNYRLNRMTAAFDALHGLAFVNPIESTSEMRLAGGTAQQKSMQEYGDPEVVWNAMAAAGDLTTPPEKKL